jgi:hypothetical protein
MKKSKINYMKIVKKGRVIEELQKKLYQLLKVIHCENFTRKIITKETWE